MHRALPLLLLAVTLAPPSAAQATKPGSDLPDSPSQSRRAGAAADRKSQAAVQKELTVRSPYEPLTDRQKFNRFLRHTVSPYTFASAAMSATSKAPCWRLWALMALMPAAWCCGSSGPTSCACSAAMRLNG